jgi:hypothetical protein
LKRIRGSERPPENSWGAHSRLGYERALQTKCSVSSLHAPLPSAQPRHCRILCNFRFVLIDLPNYHCHLPCDRLSIAIVTLSEPLSEASCL